MKEWKENWQYEFTYLQQVIEVARLRQSHCTAFSETLTHPSYGIRLLDGKGNRAGVAVNVEGVMSIQKPRLRTEVEAAQLISFVNYVH